MKVDNCKVCETMCVWMPHDGDLYIQEVCSDECLALTASAHQPDGAELDTPVASCRCQMAGGDSNVISKGCPIHDTPHP